MGMQTSNTLLPFLFSFFFVANAVFVDPKRSELLKKLNSESGQKLSGFSLNSYGAKRESFVHHKQFGGLTSATQDVFENHDFLSSFGIRDKDLDFEKYVSPHKIGFKSGLDYYCTICNASLS